jgi:hypothetical protein
MSAAKLIAVTVGVLSIYQYSYAEWVQLGSAKSGLYNYCLHPELIKIEGILRSTLVMFNCQNTTDQVKSLIALSEYNCEEKAVTTNYLIQYDGELATGNVLITSAPPKAQDHWRFPEQGSVRRAILDAVCDYDGIKPILRF